MKKLKLLAKPSVILTVVAFVVIFVLLIVCSPGRVDSKMEASTDYMQSDNLALNKASFSDSHKTKALTDGKSSTSSSSMKRNNSEMLVDLGKVTEFNTVILKEDGLNVKSFEILVSDDNKTFRRVFASDKIEYMRFCSLDPVSARYVKLSILESDAPSVIKEIEIYNEPKRSSDDFRVCGYIANSWLGTAEDTSKTLDERKELILNDMSNYKLELLTHIFFYCGIGFDANGNVYVGSPDLNEEQKQIKEEALALVMECLREKCDKNVKISGVFGIGTGAAFANPAMDTNKDHLIAELLAFADKFGFDGIDFDYEFPISKYDYQVFDTFLIDLKAAMKAKAAEENSEVLLLSCAFGTRDINYSKEAKEALDFVNVMTYDIFDQDGYHSSFWGCGPQATVYYESIGIDRKKINLGIPFYGTQIHSLMEQYGYTNLKDYDYYRNIYICNDSLGLPTPVYFNSPSMVRDKTAYALNSGMGGIMIWHTTADLPYENEFSLWRAVVRALDIYGRK